MLNSKEVPQANVLYDVIRTVSFVEKHKGSTYKMIARHIEKGERQGRYYRHSAQLLGFIDNHRNSAWILPDGEHFLSLSGDDQIAYLTRRVSSLSVFQMAKKLIVSNPGCTEADVYQLLNANGITDNTALRRASSVVNWLVELKIAKQVGEKLYLR